MKCNNLTLVVLSAFALLFSSASAACGSVCRFRLCKSVGPARGSGTGLNLRAPKTPAQGPVICLPGSDIGFVRKVGEAFIEGPDKSISKWRPSGLTKKYKKKFISVGKVKPLGRSSPIRIAASGNQWQKLNDACVRLPIVQYEVRAPNFKIVNTPGNADDCVSFTAMTPTLQVEVSWQSRDDLDLFVFDPNGNELSRFNEAAGNGRFGNDIAVGVCGSKPVAVGKENVRWASGKSIPSGTYRVVLRHFRNCNAGKTPYQIRVVLNGNLILIKKGKSNAKNNNIITEQTFTV